MIEKIAKRVVEKSAMDTGYMRELESGSQTWNPESPLYDKEGKLTEYGREHFARNRGPITKPPMKTPPAGAPLGSQRKGLFQGITEQFAGAADALKRLGSHLCRTFVS